MGLPAVPDIARDTIAGTERAARVEKDTARDSIVVVAVTALVAVVLQGQRACTQPYNQVQVGMAMRQPL